MRGFFSPTPFFPFLIFRFEMTGGEIRRGDCSLLPQTTRENRLNRWLLWLGSKAEKEAVVHCPYSRNGAQCRYEPPSANERQLFYS